MTDIGTTTAAAGPKTMPFGAGWQRAGVRPTTEEPGQQSRSRAKVKVKVKSTPAPPDTAWRGDLPPSVTPPPASRHLFTVRRVRPHDGQTVSRLFATRNGAERYARLLQRSGVAVDLWTTPAGPWRRLTVRPPHRARTALERTELTS